MARVREFDTDAALARAAEAFRDRGYGETSMRDLSLVTGVAVGSLYTAFGSKDGLYRAALERYGQDLGARGERLLSGGTAREDLRAFLLDHVAEVTSDPRWPGCLVVGSAQERAGHDPAVHQQFEQALAGLRAAFTAVLERGRVDGSVREGVDVEAVAELLVLVLQGVRVTGVADEDRALMTAAVDLALTVL